MGMSTTKYNGVTFKTKRNKWTVFNDKINRPMKKGWRDKIIKKKESLGK